MKQAAVTSLATAVVLALAACGGSKASSVLVQHGNGGDTTSVACGERTNLELAEVTARRPVRVTAARLVDASPGLRAVDVLGYTGPRPSLTNTKTVGTVGSNGDKVVVGELSGPMPEDLAVHLPGGVPISQDAKRPTVLFVTVAASCSRSVASGRSQAHLSAHSVEVTMDAGGKSSTQTLTTQSDLCVSKTAPDRCP